MIHHIAIGTTDVLRMKDFYLALPGIFLLQEFYYAPSDGPSSRLDSKDTLRSVWLKCVDSETIIMIEKGAFQAPRALVFSVFRAACEEGSVLRNTAAQTEVAESRIDISSDPPGKSKDDSKSGNINKKEIYYVEKYYKMCESFTEYTFYFRDPDGNLIGYSSYPEKLSDYGIFPTCG